MHSSLHSLLSHSAPDVGAACVAGHLSIVVRQAQLAALVAIQLLPLVSPISLSLLRHQHDGLLLSRGEFVGRPHAASSGCRGPLRLRGGGRIMRLLYRTYRRSASSLPAPAVDVLLRMGVRERDLPEDVREAVMRGCVSVEQLSLFLGLEQAGWGGSISRWLAKRSPALRDRILADQRFVLVLMCEVVVGIGTKLAAQLVLFGTGFFSNLDFVALALALEFVGDLLTACLFAPAVPMSQEGTWTAHLPFFEREGLSHLLLGSRLIPIPTTMFEVGKYSRQQRAASLIVRGWQLCVVSLAVCWVGEVCRRILLFVRRCASWLLAAIGGGGSSASRGGGRGARRAAPAASYFSEAVTFSVFMATSTNFRLHLVRAVEERILSRAGRRPLPPATTMVTPSEVAEGLVLVLRFLNCWMGGVSWLAYKHLLACALSANAVLADGAVASEHRDQLHHQTRHRERGSRLSSVTQWPDSPLPPWEVSADESGGQAAARGRVLGAGLARGRGQSAFRPPAPASQDVDKAQQDIDHDGGGGRHSWEPPGGWESERESPRPSWAP